MGCCSPLVFFVVPTRAASSLIPKAVTSVHGGEPFLILYLRRSIVSEAFFYLGRQKAQGTQVKFHKSLPQSSSPTKTPNLTAACLLPSLHLHSAPLPTL